MKKFFSKFTLTGWVFLLYAVIGVICLYIVIKDDIAKSDTCKSSYYFGQTSDGDSC